MEKLLNHCDKESMKMAILKHEETFREQVYELHRLYQIQKLLMKDIPKNPQNNPHYGITSNEPELKHCLDSTGFSHNLTQSAQDDESHDLELTLGPRCYSNREIKGDESAFRADFGPSFSSSSTTGSNHIKRSTKGSTRDELLSQLSNQDRLNSPPWLFQALSLKMT